MLDIIEHCLLLGFNIHFKKGYFNSVEIEISKLEGLNIEKSSSVLPFDDSHFNKKRLKQCVNWMIDEHNKKHGTKLTGN